jgi:AraC family transcriptional regulator
VLLCWKNVKQQLVELNAARGPDSSGRVDLRDDIPQVITSQAFDWPGLRLEAGQNNIAAVDDVTGVGHYVSMNLDDRPLTMEVKGPTGFRRVVLRRGSAWVCPADEMISVRVNSNFHYVRMSIDPVYFDRLVAPDPGAPRIELRRTFGITKSQIGHILGALVAESDAGNPGGVAFVEALAAGISHQVALHAGVRPLRTRKLRGGLSADVRRRTLEYMDTNIDGTVTIDALAREAGLSPAHFSRAFKETIGRSPHCYLLAMRLEHSRRMLDEPDAILSNVALRTGFADQAHFTRLFKREFGVTPGVVLKSRRRTLTEPK